MQIIQHYKIIKMNKNQLLAELSLDIQESATKSFITNLEEAKKVFSKAELANELSKLLLLNYTSFREEGIAYFLELIIKSDSELALMDGDNNKFFKVAVMRGSFSLLECLFEKAYDPHFLTIDEDEKFDFITNLSLKAFDLDEKLLENNKKVYKGQDFSGGILNHDTNQVIIAPEDYEVLNDIYERYNAIVGRKEIIKFLDKLIS